MGLLAVGLNTMGVWTAGPQGMGLMHLGGSQGGHHNHQGHHSGPEGAATGAEATMLAYPTREEAEARKRKNSVAQGCIAWAASGCPVSTIQAAERFSCGSRGRCRAR
jgi:hypothetical protein